MLGDRKGILMAIAGLPATLRELEPVLEAHGFEHYDLRPGGGLFGACISETELTILSDQWLLAITGAAQLEDELADHESRIGRAAMIEPTDVAWTIEEGRRRNWLRDAPFRLQCERNKEHEITVVRRGHRIRGASANFTYGHDIEPCSRCGGVMRSVR
jgi:hypothetical protein